MLNNPNQFDIDRQRRNDMLKQSELDHLASLAHPAPRRLYSAALAQLGRTLVTVGQSLQQYNQPQERPVITPIRETGTFVHIDPA